MVGTRHQAQLRVVGTGRGPHSLPVPTGTVLRLACFEIRGCSCHPMASASVPRGQQHPLGRAALPGDIEHPQRGWLAVPADTRVAPECKWPFGVSPVPVVSPNHAWVLRDSGTTRRGGTGPWVPRCAGEDDDGCGQRVLLTQDLPKWLLLSRWGTWCLACGSKQMDGAG